jgi:hypothetical protein
VNTRTPRLEQNHIVDGVDSGKNGEPAHKKVRRYMNVRRYITRSAIAKLSTGRGSAETKF